MIEKVIEEEVPTTEENKERLRLLTVVRGETLRNRDIYERPPRYELFFPNFVMKELCVGLAFLIIIFTWAYYKDAPLYELSNPAETPSHIKAAWYFVGLQELLAYFDPYLAGVIIPSLILGGLYLVPFLDPDPVKGIGRFAFKERKFAIGCFLGGYVMWYALLLVGMFFRGTYWSFYWPWEDQSVVKATEVALWSFPLPAGIAFLVCYGLLMLLLPAVIFQDFFFRVGLIRYFITFNLFAAMCFVPIKVLLRNGFHVKYVLVTPWFNI
ncbi:MAG TPA: hypothetical protein ACFYD3_03350 [Candidatus Hypogeohydataceae bacterium YC41]